ncbi:MAG: FkbM family methyltransferase [Blastocatellia bacterium]
MKWLLDRILILLRPFKPYLLRHVLGAYCEWVVARANGALFVVNLEDRRVHYDLRMLGKWEDDYLGMLGQRVSRAGDALVLGAHIGSLAIPLARQCREVIAFEPSPPSFNLLTLNMRLNDVRNMVIHNLAASGQAGPLGFLSNRFNSGGSKRVPKFALTVHDDPVPERITVQAVRLDDFLGERAFDLILMDIEGSEYEALCGMQRLLGRARALAIEFLPEHLRDVSGVTVDQFLAVIAPHFSTLFIPSKQLRVDAAGFSEALNGMYARGEGDGGIIFEKAG